MVVRALPPIYIKGTMTKSSKKNLFANQKETDRAIQAAVDQYEIYRNNTLTKHKRSRKNRAKNKRAKLRGNS